VKEVLLSGDLSRCRKLVKSASQEIEGSPPLAWAVESGSLPLVKWLLGQPGIEVDALDQDGRTPLHRLLRTRYSELTETSQLDILKLLVTKGANPSVRDHQGQSPRSVAERFFPELIPLLPRTASPAPPLRKLPLAQPWKAPRRPLRLRPVEVATWTGVVAACGITGYVLFQARTVMKPVPTPEPRETVAVAPPGWKTNWEHAQLSRDVGAAASFARQALEQDPGSQADKGEVYDFAAKAYLQVDDLAGASYVLRHYKFKGHHTPELDKKMADFRGERNRRAQTKLAGLLKAAQSQLRSGSSGRAQESLAEADTLAKDTDQPKPESPVRAQLQQLAQRSSEREKTAAAAYLENRRRKAAEEEAERRRLLHGGHYVERPHADGLPTTDYPQAGYAGRKKRSDQDKGNSR
jgi:hypothetical protein